MSVALFRPLLLLSGALFLGGCHHAEPADPRTDPPLVLAATVIADASTHPRFTGVVAARVESELGFRVAGKVTARLFDVGQHVRRGQVLMRLDPNDLTLGVTAGEGEAAAARAHSVQADADLARLDGLVKVGAISAQDFDRARATADAARAQLNAAVAQVSMARNAGNYAELSADVDGIVVRRSADEGQVVAAGQSVITVAKDGPREAAIDLPETVRPELGSDAIATLYGQRTKSAAKLRELSLAADPMTRTFAARYVLAGDAANAPLGSTITVELTKNGDASQTALPMGALYDRGEGPGVWLIDLVVALGGPELHEGQTVRTAPLAKVAP
jgi:RND family efflux transporter MFP subunit